MISWGSRRNPYVLRRSSVWPSQAEIFGPIDRSACPMVSVQSERRARSSFHLGGARENRNVLYGVQRKGGKKKFPAHATVAEPLGIPWGRTYSNGMKFQQSGLRPHGMEDSYF